MPKHILCADDSVTMQKVVAITFAHTDYQVTGARSADEALAMAKHQRPDLVLADAVMPGKTGYDLCQALKSDPALRAVPVVILCGNSQAYDEGRGKQVGADAFLAKPWDTQIFIDKVGEILARTAQHGVAQAATATPMPAARPASVPPPAAPPRPLAGPAPNPPAQVAAPARPMVPPPPAGMPRPVAPPTPSAMATAARPPEGLPKPPPGLPRPPAGLPRPPLIRGATTSPRPVGAGHHQPAPAPGMSRPAAPNPALVRPASMPQSGPAMGGPPPPNNAPLTPAQAAAAAARAANARSATIMGMPAMALPPAAPSAPLTPVATPTPPPPGPPPAAPPLAARPAPVTPIARPMAPPAAPTPPPPAPAARPLPGADALAEAAKRVAAAGVLATREAAQAQGLDPRGVDYDAIAKLSREVIEQIAWEVVPQLAEIIIRENLDRLARK